MHNDANRPPAGGYKGLAKVCQYMLQKGGNGTISNYKGTNKFTFGTYPAIFNAIDNYFQRKVEAAWGNAEVTVARNGHVYPGLVPRNYALEEGEFVVPAPPKNDLKLKPVLYYLKKKLKKNRVQFSNHKQ